MNEKTIEKVILKFCKSDAKFKKKNIISAKPATIIIHASHHCVESSNIFQTPLHKTTFDSRTTLNPPIKQHESCPHMSVYISSCFFKITLNT